MLRKKTLVVNWDEGGGGKGQDDSVSDCVVTRFQHFVLMWPLFVKPEGGGGMNYWSLVCHQSEIKAACAHTQAHIYPGTCNWCHSLSNRHAAVCKNVVRYKMNEYGFILFTSDVRIQRLFLFHLTGVSFCQSFWHKHIPTGDLFQNTRTHSHTHTYTHTHTHTHTHTRDTECEICLFHGHKRVWLCMGARVFVLCVGIPWSELQWFQCLTHSDTLLSCFETHYKENNSQKNQNHQQQNIKSHLCSPPCNLLSPRLRLCPTPLDPPTSIEKIKAIHYHYRQEEIQGQREWNASHRFFWHIHHICDEQDRQAVCLTSAAQTRTG